MIRGYRGDVLYADAQLGRLVEGLQSLGLVERTAIVVTSDHGEGLGDHGRLTHGANLFEELVRVPLVVRGPGIPAGQKLAGAAQLEDLMPTLLELLGLPAPDGLDGRSLLPWIEGRSPHSPREAVLGRRRVYPDRPDLFFLRSGLRKWIGELGREGTVYALDADPRERLGEPASAPEGITRLEAAGQAAGATAVQDLDEESRRALEALGYLDDGDDAR
jgi:arylsulfatase A-like enzyme